MEHLSSGGILSRQERESLMLGDIGGGVVIEQRSIPLRSRSLQWRLCFLDSTTPPPFPSRLLSPVSFSLLLSLPIITASIYINHFFFFFFFFFLSFAKSYRDNRFGFRNPNRSKSGTYTEYKINYEMDSILPWAISSSVLESHRNWG